MKGSCRKVRFSDYPATLNSGKEESMTDLIKVILDEGGPDKNLVRKGYCQIIPSMRFPDTTDGLIVGRITADAFFDRSSEAPYVMLLPCDLVGPQTDDGPGWNYLIKYSTDFPGRPQTWAFNLLSTNGSEQKLSDLATVPVARPGQQYIPIPSGSAPDVNQIWISDGNGYTGHWGSLDSGTDKNYTQDFTVSTMVSVPHNLGKKPAVSVVDSAGDEMDVPFTYVDDNNLTLYLKSATGGTVTCN